MKRRVTRKTKQIHKVYEECKKVFAPSKDFMSEISDIEDEEEKEFYVLLSNFFLQQKQKEVINKGLF